MKLEKKVRIKNKLGLHTRPATVIVKLLQDVKSSVRFSCRRETVNARSVLSILMLAAKKNSQITIIVDGEDATVTMEKLIAAFEAGFGESAG
ncbi:MAG: HPr family phosphocarrier protein [Waddliaceae bacterium]